VIPTLYAKFQVEQIGKVIKGIFDTSFNMQYLSVLRRVLGRQGEQR
jgi:hypothetical protein